MQTSSTSEKLPGQRDRSGNRAREELARGLLGAWGEKGAYTHGPCYSARLRARVAKG